MSKGTKIYHVRLPEELLDLVVAAINLRGYGKTGKAWTLSDFIRIALVEKIKKMDRGRGRELKTEGKEKRTAYLKRLAVDPDATFEGDPDSNQPLDRGKEGVQS